LWHSPSCCAKPVWSAQQSWPSESIKRDGEHIAGRSAVE
jgi:hypothetical protein